ncbi:MAG: RNA polymerase sigma factor (sigma-70 family) [Candidatus Paceibacteria bacterium]|jgi:RNA polymerase sigma factor (sigma-70 family)
MTTQSTAQPTNDTLWQEICDQQESAFTRLESLVTEVCGVVFRHPMVPPGERERLLQDVLVSVWEFAGKQKESPRNLRAFLKWRARGVLTTFRRELQSTRRNSSIQIDFPLPDGSTRQIDEAVMKELSETFRLCREELQGGHREIWEARYERDLDPSQTAEELGIELGAVAVRLHRAKDLLMQCLQKKGVFA